MVVAGLVWTELVVACISWRRFQCVDGIGGVVVEVVGDVMVAEGSGDCGVVVEEVDGRAFEFPDWGTIPPVTFLLGMFLK